ncbi:MAG: hypothetical protein RDV41_14810, partial [Planctomycetota bacterium]|nr:hypothetical protein [Planctomycetota bacterium]
KRFSRVKAGPSSPTSLIFEAPAGKSREINVRLLPAHYVFVTVVDEKNLPLAKRSVICSDAHPEETTTAENGKAVFYGIEPQYGGSEGVPVTHIYEGTDKAGCVFRVSSYAFAEPLPPAQAEMHALTLVAQTDFSTHKTVIVGVVTIDGACLSEKNSILVSVYADKSAGREFMIDVWCDKEGRFTLTGLPDGKYHYRIVAASSNICESHGEWCLCSDRRPVSNTEGEFVLEKDSTFEKRWNLSCKDAPGTDRPK